MSSVLVQQVLASLKRRGWVLERRGGRLLYQPDDGACIPELFSLEALAGEIVAEAAAVGGELLVEGGAT